MREDSHPPLARRRAERAALALNQFKRKSRKEAGFGGDQSVDGPGRGTYVFFEGFLLIEEIDMRELIERRLALTVLGLIGELLHRGAAARERILKRNDFIRG